MDALSIVDSIFISFFERYLSALLFFCLIQYSIDSLNACPMKFFDEDILKIHSRVIFWRVNVLHVRIICAWEAMRCAIVLARNSFAALITFLSWRFCYGGKWWRGLGMGWRNVCIF